MDSFYSLLKMKKYIKRIKKSNDVATLLGKFNQFNQFELNFY